MSRFDQGRLNSLADIVLKHVGHVYQYFGIGPFIGTKVIFSRCFVHGGDNNTALNLYHKADYRVHWKCRTHGCHEDFGNSLLSMVRGALSHTRHGWSKPGDETVDLQETVDFLLDLYGLDFNNLDESNINFKYVTPVQFDTTKPLGQYTREFYRKSVDIPSGYFICRGYNKETMEEFDVGECNRVEAQMYNRAVVPIYDYTGEHILGCTGRSKFDQCAKCKHYHDPWKICGFFPKWRHSKGLQRERILYNYHRAQPFAEESRKLVIVESPGNVWRLWEAGVKNAVALLGTALNPLQKLMIDESGALTVLILMDNDPPGVKAAQKIQRALESKYNVCIIGIDYPDVGEMSVKQVQEEIIPQIEGCY